MIRRRIAYVAIFALCAAPFMLPEFWLTLLNFAGISSLIGLGLVLLTGAGGMTSFGQAAFAGIAGYASAYLTTSLGFSAWEALPLALLAAALAAVLLGAVTLRLSGHYLPISTIAWAAAIFYLFARLPALGGQTGLAGIPAVAIGPFQLVTGQSDYCLIWLAVLAAFVTLTFLLRSRSGRAIRALRGGALLAESFGIRVFSTRLVAFVYAAVLAGLAGWLYVHFIRFINPTPFDITAGIKDLFVLMIGGAAYPAGALAGAALLTALPDALQAITSGQNDNYDLIAYGVIIVLVLQRTRLGIIGGLVSRFPKLGAPPVAVVEGAEAALPSRKMTSRGSDLLRVRDAEKWFGGLCAVQKMQFDVAAGEIVGLIGPNGAGKSTMFNLITGALAPNRGEITLGGAKISGASPLAAIQLGLSRSFQHVRLLGGMSVLENVMIGGHLRGRKGFFAGLFRWDRAEERALAAEAARQLRRVGLADVMYRPAGSLALGQQRLVEVARALCADPCLLLLDEPAAGLRHAEKIELARLLDGLRDAGIAVLLVEHDMDFVMNLVDRLVVMEGGRKLVEGLPEAVQADPRVLDVYLGGVA
jgi:branched-chain amino acid transport system permease protein